MSNYEEVSESIVILMNKIIEESFSSILNAKIKLLYYMKKKSSKGSLVLGSMTKATPILRHMTSSPNGDDGFDYFMFLDGNVFPELDNFDQIRIIRHELNHIDIDIDANDPFKTTGHEIEDFYKEIEFNRMERKSICNNRINLF